MEASQLGRRDKPKQAWVNKLEVDEALTRLVIARNQPCSFLSTRTLINGYSKLAVSRIDWSAPGH